MSTRRSVPAGVRFIGAVGGVAGALFALGTGALIVRSVRGGRVGVALQLLPMFALSVADVGALYGLVRLRRWGYVWTRRLFGLTLLATLPAALAGSPVDAGTVAFSAFVLLYLWLAETSTFRPAVPSGEAPPHSPDQPEDGPVDVEIGEPGDDGDPPADADPLGGDGDAGAEGGNDADDPTDSEETDTAEDGAGDESSTGGDTEGTDPGEDAEDPDDDR